MTDPPAVPPPPRPRPAHLPRRPLDLALQGGGAHGAYTWGVLDRLLEDERIEISGISGTSAGAMNAVALADGLMRGGRSGAREALQRFWHRIAMTSPFGALQAGPWAPMFDPVSPWLAPMQAHTDWLGRLYTPQQLNPLDLNPLRDILAAEIDFESVRRCDKTRLYIAATHVRSGRLHVFQQRDLTADKVLASACLPLIFRAIEIDGEAYWDGGYSGNPSLLPLLKDGGADDLLLVPTNPIRRESVPTTMREILDRVDEITFNASLLKEMRSIALLKQMIADEGDVGRRWRQPLFAYAAVLRVHRLDADADLSALGPASNLNTGWAFLQQLHDIGHRVADDWLQRNYKHLGRRSTIDLAREYLE